MKPPDAATERQLTRLIIEFAWLVDNQQADSIYELMAEDAQLRLHYAPLIGRAAIAEWGIERAKMQRTTRHLMSNFRFTVIADDVIEGTCSALVFVHNGEGTGPALPWSLTDYHDRFLRTAGGWLFQSRVSSEAFFTG
jgi:hypothetical protein